MSWTINLFGVFYIYSSNVLGGTRSPAEKAFKANVACADSMLMSPITFPEVSSVFFFLFFDGLGGRIKMLSHSGVL